jgi:ATP-binding cassette subfamily F protein uup
MLKPADLLLLDEPTNDLDIPSLEVLEQSLAEFAGALVLVTHDRYLLDRVSKQILALDGKGHAEYFADLAQWEDYRENRRAQESRKIAAPAPKAGAPPSKSKKTLTTKELKELEGMEEAIHTAEQKLKDAQARMDDPAIAANVGELLKRHKEVDAEKANLEALFKRWEELEAKKNQPAAI